MGKIGNIINMILLLAALTLAGEWSFGFYDAGAGLLLGIAVAAAIFRLQRAPAADDRFDSTRGSAG